MPSQPNNLSNQIKGWLANLNFKSSLRREETNKKDDLIPAKDKSPDDLEIED